MRNDDDNPAALQRALWRLRKDSREISCVVIERKRRGWELRVTRSDSVARSLHLYPTRPPAVFEARRLAASYVALGWTLYEPPAASARETETKDAHVPMPAPRCPYCRAMLKRDPDLAAAVGGAHGPTSFTCPWGCGTFTSFNLAALLREPHV